MRTKENNEKNNIKLLVCKISGRANAASSKPWIHGKLQSDFSGKVYTCEYSGVM